jgi:xanthine dehydrogenase accessory factor
MRDILDQLQSWAKDGNDIALATVVSTWGSSPRPVGAHMAVRADGSMLGSVSGGCVEGAVVQEAIELLESGHARLLKFGVSDESAWEVGLACGGSIEVFIQRFDLSMLGPIASGLSERKTRALVTVISGPTSLLGTTGFFDESGFIAGESPEALADRLEGQIAEAIKQGRSARLSIEYEGEKVEYFIDVFMPSPTIIMIGGVHISVALDALARSLGYRTVVIDPRRSFASQERFPAVDQLIQSWPEQGLEAVGIDANTAVAVLTHDPKIDDPALKQALQSPAFYIGALGSRSTHAKRVERLRQQGLTDAMLARLRAPIGLDIGARTPQEIALSILAEITAARHDKLATTA